MLTAGNSTQLPCLFILPIAVSFRISKRLLNGDIIILSFFFVCLRSPDVEGMKPKEISQPEPSF